MKFLILVCSFHHIIVYTVSGTPILGGLTANEKKYKYQASLQEYGRRNEHFCGGSVISERFILTAAHCLDNDRIMKNIKRLLAVTGITKLTDEGDKYFVKSFVMHEQWNKAKIANDIAVLETTERIRFSSAVKPISLATHDPDVKTITVLAGWGFTSDYVSGTMNPIPDSLKVAQFRTISLMECRRQFNEARYPGRLVSKNNVCIAQPKFMGICNGDSGDALTNLDDGTQIGIVSFSGQCSEGMPGVATSVASFLDWIKEKTGIK